MIVCLSLNEMVLQSGEHQLSLRQRQPDGPGRILVNRRAAADLMNADGPICPGHLHHDPPLHPAPPALRPGRPYHPQVLDGLVLQKIPFVGWGQPGKRLLLLLRAQLPEQVRPSSTVKLMSRRAATAAPETLRQRI
jgi:hypothetical protein